MSRFIDSIAAAAQHSGKGVRVVRPDYSDTFFTWSQVHARADEVARGLARHGVMRDDRVAALVTDPAKVAPLVQAVWRRGAAATLLQHPAPRTDLGAWLQTTVGLVRVLRPRVLVVDGPFIDVANHFGEVGVRVVSEADLHGGPPARAVDCGEDDNALLQLSSGSTGTPKVVAISHRGMYENWSAMASVYELDSAADVFVSWLPLFHDLGMNCFLVGPMQSGADVVCVPPDVYLSTSSVWPELISRFGGSVTGGPNFAYSMLARSLMTAPVGAYDLSRMRVMINGGEPIDAGTLRRFVDAGARFGLNPNSLVMGYGMAEATLGIAGTPPGAPPQTETVDVERLEAEGYASLAPPEGDYRRREVVVLGRSVPGIGVKVVDESGQRVRTRAVGEIHIRGGAVTKRYLTADGWQDARDGHGWLATGDLGYLTDAGELVVCGRKKDTIIVGGRKVFPTHVESAAGHVDGVRAGNAVALPMLLDEREHLAVIVESRLHTDAAEEARIRTEVIARVRDELGIGPRCVLVVAPGQLPKTSSGKLRRSAAAALFEESLVASASGVA